MKAGPQRYIYTPTHFHNSASHNNQKMGATPIAHFDGGLDKQR